jgi:hypothetical protein
MNYFNYFTEIEDIFIRRRGKHLLLSPMDWALIESWKEMGVPLHVALSGIERAFDSFESKPRKRSVKSLMYCQEEVEAQYSEWLESQVGAGEQALADEHPNGNETATEMDAQLPFAQAIILEHLERARLSLTHIFDGRKQSVEDNFCRTLQRIISRLDELEKDFARASQPQAEKLENALTSLEKILDEALLASLPTAELTRARAETESQLQPYRSNMETAIYEQTFNNLLLKRLREQHNVPRLSLFYL